MSLLLQNIVVDYVMGTLIENILKCKKKMIPVQECIYDGICYSGGLLSMSETLKYM